MVVYHHINAYEEDGVVVVDLISYSDSKLYQMFYLETLRQQTPDYLKTTQDFSPPTCKRFRLPLSIDQVPASTNPTTNIPYHRQLNERLSPGSQDVTTGTNLLTDSRAEARLQKDGSVFCTPEVLFQGEIRLESRLDPPPPTTR